MGHLNIVKFMTQQQVTITYFNPKIKCRFPDVVIPAVISSLVSGYKCSPRAFSEPLWRLIVRSSAADKDKSHECEENTEFSV